MDVDDAPATDELDALVAASSIRSVRVVAWRDLDDPEAGGSELHADRVAALWADAGIDVELRTSMVAGEARQSMRHGYRVVRWGGRYQVFPQVISEAWRFPEGRADAVVDIWNGMPFFSPLWHRGPRLCVLHHVHGEMWRMTLKPAYAAVGDTVERRLAPLVYRGTPVATLSASSREEIIGVLGLPACSVHVVEPGVEPQYTQGGRRAGHPLVVAVGRLVPVKRHDLLFRALAEARRTVPELRAVIVGEGYERPRLEALRRELGAEEWLELRGRVDERAKLALYRSAWVLASASLREGWGMTLTEAAACGTPSVATDIPGHRDAVDDGVTGLLVGDDGLGRALARVLGDDELRGRLGRAARARAGGLTWARTAASLFELLDPAAARAVRGAAPGSR
jgi:glycosyltransferase involved in cell wall biosynthesis